jgi:hypothetical protein
VVPDDANGKKTRCKKCHQVFAVAVASPPDDVDFSPFPPLAPPGVKRKTTSPGRKVLLLALLAGGIVTGAGILVTVFWPKAGAPIGGAGPSRVSDTSFQQLKLGMRLDQVQAVLGEGEALTDGEIPPALAERIDDPKVTGQIDLVEPQRWRRWDGSHETIFVGLSQTETGDRVTVLAFAKASGLKLECGNTFEGGAAATRPRGQPTEEQLRQALTKENYDKLHKGLTEQEVRHILGPPVTNRVLERHAGFEARQLIWRLGQPYIIVVFHNGKLAEMDSGNGSGGPLP